MSDHYPPSICPMCGGSGEVDRAAPSTPEPSGPLAAVLASHTRADGLVVPPLVEDASGYRYETPEEFARSINAALRDAPSTEPALDVILGALRDGANDCPAYLDTDDARAGWSAAFARAEWLVEDVVAARLAESQP